MILGFSALLSFPLIVSCACFSSERLTTFSSPWAVRVRLTSVDLPLRVLFPKVTLYGLYYITASSVRGPIADAMGNQTLLWWSWSMADFTHITMPGSVIWTDRIALSASVKLLHNCGSIWQVITVPSSLASCNRAISSSSFSFAFSVLFFSLFLFTCQRERE